MPAGTRRLLLRRRGLRRNRQNLRRRTNNIHRSPPLPHLLPPHFTEAPPPLQLFSFLFVAGGNRAHVPNVICLWLPWGQRPVSTVMVGPSVTPPHLSAACTPENLGGGHRGNLRSHVSAAQIPGSSCFWTLEELGPSSEGPVTSSRSICCLLLRHVSVFCCSVLFDNFISEVLL